jgi:hypothetical protein
LLHKNAIGGNDAASPALLLRGAFRTRTGYGLITRRLVREFFDRSIPLELENIFNNADRHPIDALDPALLALGGHRRARRASCARLVPARSVDAMQRCDGDVADLAIDLAVRCIAPWSDEVYITSRWWQPDEEAACAFIREAIEGADWPTAPERLASYTWKQSAARVIEVLGAHGDEAS